MTYEQWEQLVPDEIRNDALWRIKAYRQSLFLSDLSWHDTARMLKDPRMLSMADQLYRACGKIGAQIAEGYSRGTGRDRVRFYEYALGSLRESRDWYYKGRRVLSDDVYQHRMQLVSECVKLVLAMIRKDRRGPRFTEESD